MQKLHRRLSKNRIHESFPSHGGPHVQGLKELDNLQFRAEKLVSVIIHLIIHSLLCIFDQARPCTSHGRPT